MKRKYKAIYNESTDTYTLYSLNKPKKTAMYDAIENVKSSDLRIVEKNMGITIVEYCKSNDNIDNTKETSINESKKTKVNNEHNIKFGEYNL